MSWARPDLLWLAAALPAVVALAWWRYVRRRRRVAAALGGAALARRLGAGDLAAVPWGRAALVVLAAAALGAAAAGPRWGLEAVAGQTRATSVVLALDVSNSMLADDVQPSRLERERLLASRLLRELAGDRLGLVVFAGRGYVLSPLTVDQSALQLYLDALDPEILSTGGTAISSGLRQATDLARGTEASGDRAVVLVTDGEALEEEPLVLEAAERAAAAGVTVHTVGVGTAEGAQVPEIDPGTGRQVGWVRDVDGSIVVSRMDEELLREIARRTGGSYTRLGDAGSTERLVDALAGLERGVADAAGRRLEPKDRTGWLVALALALLALEAVASRLDAGASPLRRRRTVMEERAA